MPSSSPAPRRVVVLSGSPVDGSRTRSLAAEVARRLEARGFGVRLVDLRALPAAELLHGPGDGAGAVRAALDAVRRAHGVVVATPVHHAAYSGILKAFLDLLPRGGLDGKVALPLAVGGAPAHALMIDYALRPVLVSLGAAHVTRGHLVLGEELERAPGGAPRLLPQADERLRVVLHEFTHGVRLHARGEPGPVPPSFSAPRSAQSGAERPLHLPTGSSTMSTHHETLVIGAGPAGLQLGFHLDRRGRDYLVLEAGDGPGTFFQTYPRHRMLISINKIYTGSDDPEFNLRHDWNSLLSDGDGPLFQEHSRDFFPAADTLVEYLHAYARRHAVRVRYQTHVSRISRDGARFVVESADGETFTADRLVMATGVSRPFIPEIPGIELAEGYEDVSVDPQDFVNQRVLIIGKGNSAFETADNLVSTTALIHLVSPRSLEMAWKTHYVGDLRAVNNNILDTYQLKSQNAVLDADVVGIARRPEGGLVVTFAYQHAEGEVEELTYDRVIRCTGFRFDASLFDASAAPEMVVRGRFPSVTCEWESVNQPGLYFAGTISQGLGYRKTTSGFIHGFRYNVQVLDRILAAKHHGEGWAADTVPLQPEALAARILQRVNRGSDLWQQQAFLGDMLLVRDDGSVECRESLPVHYIRDKHADRGDHCFVLTLEFGPQSDGDPFKSARVRRDNVERAADSAFLHPAIREYANGVQVSEHHVIEDLEARWGEPEHVQPLLAWLIQRIDQRRVRIGGIVGEPAAAALGPAAD